MLADENLMRLERPGSARRGGVKSCSQGRKALVGGAMTTQSPDRGDIEIDLATTRPRLRAMADITYRFLTFSIPCSHDGIKQDLPTLSVHRAVSVELPCS